MNKQLFQYAYEGIKCKKKLSITLILVLTITFSFLLFSISVLESMRKTNDEFRINIYGDWYMDVIDITDENICNIAKMPEVNDYGCMTSVGSVVAGEKRITVGTIDQTLKKIGRIKLSSGHWPQADDEVVMEADTLCAMGLDYTLGQEIELSIIIETEEMIYEINGKYRLAGIVKEFTDIWNVQYADTAIGLTGAIISENALQKLISETLMELEIIEESFVKQQLFVNVNQENREAVYDSIVSEIALQENAYTSINHCILSQKNSDSDNVRYLIYILITTIIAIIFIYMLQMENTVHNFSIMRSIGMTKKQLLKLMFYETLILCIPAMVTGSFLGCIGEYILLQIVMYGRSVPVIISIPIKKLMISVMLWIFTVLFARIVVFLLAIKVPLVGKIQLNHRKRRYIRIGRTIVVYTLCMLLGSIVIFTCMKVIIPYKNRNSICAYPTYLIWNTTEESQKRAKSGNTVETYVIPVIGDIPGVSSVYGFNEYSISFENMKEDSNPCLYAIDRADWKDVFDIESNVEDIKAFDCGECVAICIPKDLKNEIKPLTSLDIRVYYHENMLFEEDNVKIGGVLYIPFDLNTRLLAGVNEPYTIVCSKKFLEKHNIKNPSRIYIHSLYSVDNVSTDVTLAFYTSKNNLYLSNRREQYQAFYQEYTQDLIMQITMGGSISIILVLIYYSILSLEKRHNERKYHILRSIGMSKKQWERKQLSKAVRRGGITIFGGWIVYVSYVFFQQGSVSSVKYGIGGNTLLFVSSLICIGLVSAGTILISNRE